jgi:catalase
MNFMHRDEEVDYFPSRYYPAKNAPRYPIPQVTLNSRREKMVIKKGRHVPPHTTYYFV